MSSNENALVPVRTRLDSEDLAALQRIGRNEDRSVSQLVRRAVRFYLDSKRKGLV